MAPVLVSIQVSHCRSLYRWLLDLHAFICCTGATREDRGTSLIRIRQSLGPYSRPMPRALARAVLGGLAVSYERGNPAKSLTVGACFVGCLISIRSLGVEGETTHFRTLSRPLPRAPHVWWSYGGGGFSYERGTPVHVRTCCSEAAGSQN